jgi:hypothetical protein
LKCALAVSAASLTRYEGWALPLGLIFILLFLQLFIRRKRWGEREKHKLQALLSVVLIFGFIGITSWIAWNLVIFKDPLYSLTGPYSAAAQADSREYNKDYKLNPVASSSLIFDAAGQMYGLHVLAISFLGIGLYLYSGTKRKRLIFHLLTVLMMMAPILSDFAAMIQGSGEIVRTGDSWFNGRYLIFIAPLLAFGSTYLLNSVIEIRRTSRWKPPMIIFTVLLIAGSYAFTFASQTFEYGKAVALNSESLLPSYKEAQIALETGKQLGRKYEAQIALETGKQLGRSYQEGKIVVFTLSAYTQWIMLESHLPLRNFIDLSNRHYWEISEQSPWIYGNYVVLQKRVDQMTYDPLKDVVQYWHVNKQTLLEHYNMIYENDWFEIYERK